MKLIPATLSFAVFIFYFQLSLASHVKVIRFKADFANATYVDTDLAKLKVVRVNETYNRVYVKGEVIQEWPSDTVFTAAIYRKKSMYRDWNFVDVFNAYICDQTDPNWKYLPHDVQSLSRSGGEHCVKKVPYEYNDAGVFQFWELISNGEGYNYQIFKILHSGRITISITRAWVKWYE